MSVTVSQVSRGRRSEELTDVGTKVGLVDETSDVSLDVYVSTTVVSGPSVHSVVEAYRSRTWGKYVTSSHS